MLELQSDHTEEDEEHSNQDMEDEEEDAKDEDEQESGYDGEDNEEEDVKPWKALGMSNPYTRISKEKEDEGLDVLHETGIDTEMEVDDEVEEDAEDEGDTVLIWHGTNL